MRPQKVVIDMNDGSYLSLSDENIDAVLSKLKEPKKSKVKIAFRKYKARLRDHEENLAKEQAAEKIRAEEIRKSLGFRTIETPEGRKEVPVSEYDKLFDEGKIDSTGRLVDTKPVKKKTVKRKRDDREELLDAEPVENDRKVFRRDNQLDKEEELNPEDFEIGDAE